MPFPREEKEREVLFLYRRCPECGASLDPGEICDCIKNAAPDGSDPEAAQVNDFITILAQRGETVKEAEAW